MLMKHSERCRHPHGHTRQIELVLASPKLDENDMVCDFKWIKLAVGEFLDRFDHALCINAGDPMLESMGEHRERVIVFDEGDPTTELIAKRIFEFLNSAIREGKELCTDAGVTYRIQPGVRVERVRVGETPTCWAEYSEACRVAGDIADPRCTSS